MINIYSGGYIFVTLCCLTQFDRYAQIGGNCLTDCVLLVVSRLHASPYVWPGKNDVHESSGLLA
jgi:hypothetical protein